LEPDEDGDVLRGPSSKHDGRIRRRGLNVPIQISRGEDCLVALVSPDTA
jgi:hypothetical protein